MCCWERPGPRPRALLHALRVAVGPSHSAAPALCLQCTRVNPGAGARGCNDDGAVGGAYGRRVLNRGNGSDCERRNGRTDRRRRRTDHGEDDYQHNDNQMSGIGAIDHVRSMCAAVS